MNFRLASEFGGCSFKMDFLSEKCHRGNVAIYLGCSDLGWVFVESWRQFVANKVPLWVISVNHSEGGKVQTQSRKAAEKYFFKCPIKTQPKNPHAVWLIWTVSLTKYRRSETNQCDYCLFRGDDGKRTRFSRLWFFEICNFQKIFFTLTL